MNFIEFESNIEKRTKIANLIREEEKINQGNTIVIVDENGTEQKAEYRNNKIFLGETELKNLNLILIYKGNNSLIKIQKSANINRARIEVGEGCYIYFGKNFRVRQNININVVNKNNTLYIGENCNIGDANIYAGDEPELEVIIGKDFLSAYNLIIRASDGHTIFDTNTKEILNNPLFGVHIGSHVWCGLSVTIIKDVFIPSDCVVGACALVCNKQFNKHSIIAGFPAKEIKTNISWDSRSICKFLDGEKNNGKQN